MELVTFIDLSVALTGFEPFDLHATGLAEVYFKWIEAEIENTLGASGIAELERQWATIAGLEANAQKAGLAQLFACSRFGALVRGISLLWYTGAWYTDNRFGYSTLSGEAYRKGLVWKAIGAHPMAADPQGFAAWALPPPHVTLLP